MQQTAPLNWSELETYLAEIVEPTLAEFEKHRSSKRHAFLACVAVFHAIDRLTYPKNSRALRQKFCRASPEFKMIDEITHAFKHVGAGNPSKPELLFDQVINRPPLRCGVGKIGLSRAGDLTGGVTITKDVRVDVLRAAKTAVAFLRERTADT